MELDTIFQTTFTLDRAPSNAVLRLAGFQRYRLSINEAAVDKPVRLGKDWKQPDVFDVSRQLRAGENRIAVTVFNSNGPPALWLALQTEGLRLMTDESWRTSYAGATWRTARFASKPKLAPRGNRLHEEAPVLSTCLRERWSLLVLFAAVSAAGCWWAGRYGKPPGLAGPGGNRWREILPVIGLSGLWAALFANNLGMLMPWMGFEADQHLRYIQYIQEHYALPAANQGWEMFQAPLY